MSKIIPHSFMGDVIWAFNNWRENRKRRKQLQAQIAELEEQLAHSSHMTAEERLHLRERINDLCYELEAVS